MSSRAPARTAARRPPSTLLALAVVVSGALSGVLVFQSLPSPSVSAASTLDIPPGESVPALAGIESDQPNPEDRRPEDQDRPDPPRPALPLGEPDGAVPDGVTVFDDEIPAVANLEPALLGALRRAATGAAREGVELYVTSGWRSRAYQEQLLREAVSEYGSEAEASRWVATPDTSAHVSGDAVDVGPADATAWLSGHGAEYGLCQIYRNEPWHYEMRSRASDHGCPPRYTDPTHDPRMQ
ncbi:MAG TPA: M15 family metallopeptidase [Microthrixaceae bacterium]|nr:M15 family metallopeptidase [Microthrixaceae bacterium]